MSKKILIVEDEDPMRRMLTLELQAAGYEVLQAKDGKNGLKAVNDQGPDLIITDVLMPVMDGFTFYKELKSSPLTKDIPVLILTARGKMEESFRVMGADEFVTKPFNSEDLLAKVGTLINRLPASESQYSKRVLLAGVEEEVVHGMVMQLKKTGCHTDMVTTGPQVITKVVMFLPQILVLDVLMNGMESPEIIRILRQMPQGEKIPILMYSFYRLSDLGSEDVRHRALSIDKAVQLGLRNGATKYIGRYNEDSFIRSINIYLE